MNLIAAKSKGQLYFMDLLCRFTAPTGPANSAEYIARPDIATYKLPTVPNSSFAWIAQSDDPSTINWEASLAQVISILINLCQDKSKTTTRTAIIIDDLTALLFAGCPVQILVGFTRVLRRLCDTVNNH
jgi:hypothetical protein